MWLGIKINRSFVYGLKKFRYFAVCPVLTQYVALSNFHSLSTDLAFVMD